MDDIFPTSLVCKQRPNPTRRQISSRTTKPSRMNATPAIQESLQQLATDLQCPLCHQVLIHASTLACAHVFCQSCIDHYANNSWNCPVCDWSLMVRGESGGKFYKTHPEVQSVVQSLQNIERVLQQAPKEWWKMAGEVVEEDDKTIDLLADAEHPDESQASTFATAIDATR